MKKMILSLVALTMAATSLAQNTLVAVLSHETNVQMFYGSSALKNAVEVAVSGDVITLSAGTFEKCDITKGITIRGVGAEGKNVTTISGRSSDVFKVNIPQEDSNPFSIEGIQTSAQCNINVSGTMFFSKNVIYSIVFSSTSSANVKMVNCNVSTLTLSGSSNLKLSNCRVGTLTNASNTTSKADVFNCYLNTVNSAYRCSFVNCLIYYISYYSGGLLPADVSAMNCLFINNKSGGTRIDCNNAEVAQVFASYENKLVDARYYTYADVPTTDQLSEEAKTTYLGTDGKEIGLYGGQYPYSLTPTYPRITTLNVAKQASADNKLSVEIEVTATE